MKPHIYKQSEGGWACCGLGCFAIADTPKEAYDYWVCLLKEWG